MKITKHIVIEVILIAVIICQSYAIYWLYGVATQNSFSQVADLIKSMACGDQISMLIELDKDNEYKDLMKLGEYLLENGYENDRTVLHGMSRAYYAYGDIQKSAELLLKATQSGYYCEIYKPSKDGLLLDEMWQRCALSELYQQLGLTIQANEQLEKSKSLLQNVLKENYSDKLFEMHCANVSYNKIKKVIK